MLKLVSWDECHQDYGAGANSQVKVKDWFTAIQQPLIVGIVVDISDYAAA